MDTYVRKLRSRIGHELIVLPSVTVLLFDDRGRVLLVRHAGTGKWVAPGGMVEPDEEPAAAARREVREEAGCDVVLTGIQGVYGGPEFRVRYENGDEVSYVMTVYRAELADGGPRPAGRETLAAGFVAPEELGELDTARWLDIVLRDAGMWSGGGDGDRLPTAGSGGIAALYDRWAPTYDSDANRTRDLAAELLRGAADLVEGRDVAELGCGAGANTAWLAERARSVVAVDFSPRMLERARARVADPRVRFMERDIRSGLPLEDRSVDLVVVMLVLEHIAEQEPVFREVARALRPGGHLFVCELHPWRQWAGARAEFRDPATGRTTRLPAAVHRTSDYLAAAAGAGLRLERMDEWSDEYDEAAGAPPRLLSLSFVEPDAASGDVPWSNATTSSG